MTLTGHTGYVFALKILPNGDLVSGCSGGKLKIWDIEKGSVKKEINVNSRVNSFLLLKNGDFVSASDESIIIWE